MNGRVVLAVAVGVTAGYLGGRMSHRPATRTGTETDVSTAEPATTSEATPPLQPSGGTKSELDLVHVELRLRSIRSLNDWKRSNALYELAKQIPLLSIKEAIRLGDSLLERSDAYTFAQNLLERWVEADPRSVLAYGTGIPHTIHSDEAARMGAAEWARRDANAALDWAVKRPPSTDRVNLIQSVLLAMAETNPHRALDSLSVLPKAQRPEARAEILLELAKQSPEEAMEEAKKLPPHQSQFGGDYQTRILTQWMQQDSAAVARWMQEHGDDKTQRNSIAGAIAAFAQEHASEALKLADQLPPGTRRKYALSQILQSCDDLEALKTWTEAQSDPKSKTMGQLAYARALSQSDPATAAAAIAGMNGESLQGFANNSESIQVADQIFQRYAAVAGGAAVQLAASIPDWGLRKQAMNTAIAGWSENDPAAAAKYAASLPPNADRGQMLQSVARNWAQEDPAALIDWLKQSTGQELSKSTVSELLIAAAQNAPAQVAEYAKSINANTSQLSQIASFWSQTDPEAAFTWAASLPDGKSRDELLSQTLANSINIDPETALDLARQLPADRLPASASAVIASALAENNITEAQNYINGLPEGEARDKALENMLQTWGRNSPDDALAYAQKLPEGSPARTQGIAAALETLAERDPDSALRYLAKTGEADLQGAASGVIGSLANSDPNKASIWVTSLPDGSVKNEVGSQLTSAWAANDPQAAAEWLKTLPAGEFHDAAARSFALGAVQSEPQLAFAWALGFGASEDSSSPLPSVATQWLQQDPAAATAAIRNSGLSEEAINNLLKPQNGGNPVDSAPTSGTYPIRHRRYYGRPATF